MKSDCEKLKKSSVYVRDWFHRQPAVKEESLTDWLLFDVSDKIAGITYKAFTRHEEARDTGADWEWWFLFREFSAKMRVQAKKIYAGRDNYPGIAHTNKHGLQIEKLLQDAKDRNFIPLYAFYTYLQENVMCQKSINDEGVYLSGARKIFDDLIQNGRQKVLPSDLLARSIPLSCFLCCPFCCNEDADRGFLSFLSHYYYTEIGCERGEELSVEASENILGIYRKTPGYVSSLIKLGREDLPDGWEQEFRMYLEGVNSLVVYDARNRDEPKEK